MGQLILCDFISLKQVDRDRNSFSESTYIGVAGSHTLTPQMCKESVIFLFLCFSLVPECLSCWRLRQSTTADFSGSHDKLCCGQ